MYTFHIFQMRPFVIYSTIYFFFFFNFRRETSKNYVIFKTLTQLQRGDKPQESKRGLMRYTFNDDAHPRLLLRDASGLECLESRSPLLRSATMIRGKLVVDKN